MKASERPQIKCSRDAYELFTDTWDQGTIEHIEEFKLMLLTRSNRVLGIAAISKGGISGIVTDVRIILQYAIKSNASGIILCHNHPRGNLNPSESDTRLTNKVKDSCCLMDLQLLDHLIISADEGYYSFADSGLI